MESLKHVKQLIKPGVWMGSVDLRDAYYSVRVNPHFQKHFTCYWKGCYYEFLRMPNGYAQTPLLFTKLLKQPFGFLRKHGYASVVYIDDFYLQGGITLQTVWRIFMLPEIYVYPWGSLSIMTNLCFNQLSQEIWFCSGFPKSVNLPD